MNRVFLILSFVVGPTFVFAQQPFITGIDKTSAFFGETVTISGQNLNGTMQVNFGAGEATITSQSANQIQVTVPSTATTGLIIVTDLSTGLSTASSQKFSLKYGGSTLTNTDFNTDFELETNGQLSWGLCACDLDEDNDLDVITANRSTQEIRLFLNVSTPTATVFNGNTFNPSTTIRNVTCEDINGDGKSDIILGASQGTSLEHIFIIQNTNTTPGTSSFTAASFSNAIKFRLPDLDDGNVRAPQQVGLLDVDGDGKKELIVGNSTDNILFIFQNQSTTAAISFASTPVRITVPNSPTAGAFDFGDVDGDGRIDIVVVPGEASGQICALVNKSIPGSFNLTAVSNFSSSAGWISVALLDLNADGKLDIAASNSNTSTNNFATHLNNSTSTIVSFETANVQSLSIPYILSPGDLNGDGRVDLALSSLSGRIYVFENNGSGVMPTPISLTIPQSGVTESVRFLQVADFNGDSKQDIAYISRSLLNENGQFAVAINKNCVAPTITPASQTFCFGTPFSIESTRGQGLTYAWSVVTGTGAATFSNQSGNKVDVNVTAGNPITIQSTITSADGCSEVGTQDFSITNGAVPAAPSISNSVAGVICNGTDFTLSTPNTADQWIWTQPDGTVTTNSTLNLTDVSADDAGPYTLRIKSGTNCTSETGTITIQVDQPPVISITNNGEDNFCSTNSTELEVASYTGFDYSWYRNNVSTGTALTALTVTTSGDYQAEITTDSGCSLRSSVYTVAAIPPPSSLFDSDTEKCVDIEIAFSATSTGETGFALEYAWDFDDGSTATGQDTVHTYVAANTYLAQLTTSYRDVDVCSDVITQNIIISDIPEVDITAPGGSFEKCPSDSIRLELPQNYQTYSWSTGDTTYFTYAKTDRFDDLVVIDVSAVTDLSCSITSSTQVDNFPNSGFTVSSTIGTFVLDTLNLQEAESKITLTASGGTDFSWAPLGLIDTESGSVTNVFPNTQYNVVILTGTDINGCTESYPLVIVNPGLIARKTFSPNGDGIGFDCWEISNSDQIEGCDLFILDSRGRIIHQEKSPFVDNCAWDGTVDGGSGVVPEGIYYFILKCSNTDFNMTGSILLAR